MPKKSHKKLLRNGKGSGKKSQRGGANRSNSKQQLSNMKGGRKIIKYKVLQNNSAQELENLVNTELQNGWALLGAAYVQAMTKEIYEVKDFEQIDEIEFTNKDISIDNTNIDNNYVVLDKKDVDEGNIFPGLGIKISIKDKFFNPVHFPTTIKDISYDNDKALIKFDEKQIIIKNHQDIQEIKKAHLTIDAFQKITLSEEVTDGIEIGTKINIDYNGEESERTIKAMDINKTEIVLETPL